MRMLKHVFAFGMLYCSTQFVNAAEFSASQTEEIGAIVRQYLLEHPEILDEMKQNLERKQQEEDTRLRVQAVSENAKDIFNLAGDASLGKLDGDIIIVEFMDYNCGWCRKAVGEVSELVRADPRIRVKFKELPIFGEGSEYAARAALASQKQGKYWELHQALFAQPGQVTAEVVDQVAASVGLDIDKLRKDMEAPVIGETLAKNQRLATALRLSGTPAFIIDDTVVPGYVPHAEIMQLVASIRDSGTCKYC